MEKISRVHWSSGQESGVKKVKLVSIDVIDNEDVYDLSVQDNHNFFANGVLVHNCFEIGLDCRDDRGNTGFSFCNLTEQNGKKHKTPEDFYKSARLSAILGTIQAGYTDFPYMYEPELGYNPTERIARSESLLGCSITGIQEIPQVNLNPDVLRRGAEILLETNEEIAKIIGINSAARLACTKPSGCGIPTTVLRTNKGDMSYEDIFKYFGYDCYDYVGEDKLWLEIENSDLKVYDENNNEQLIDKLFVNGDADVYEFETEDGQVHTFTEEHKFKVKDKGWVKVCDLVEGDDIISFG